MNVKELAKIYPIQTGVNNPILRTKSIPVKKINDEIKNFADVLLMLMYEYDGVGLAAPQIGKNIRMIAITKWDIKGNKFNFVKDEIMINPEIIWHTDKMEVDTEGCLSVPGVEGKVKRYKSIKVKYLDITGREKVEFLSGFNSRIVQHEIDHLDGILFVDKLEKSDFSTTIKNKILST